MAPTQVFLVDDEAAVRDALGFLLASRGLHVAPFESGPALLDHLQTLPAPPSGVFVLDVRMEPMPGPRLHEALLARGLRNPVIFLSGHGDIPMVVAALKRGAFDFLEKPYSDNALVDRIEQALRVAEAMQVQDSQSQERQARLASLTDREHEVMRRVASGQLNKQMADGLHVSIRTIEVHRARVFSKLGVRSAAELAGWLAQTDPTPGKPR
ncbi:response regulator transcription factor [Inhella gelatinilytica]|uniref:Response regulator transcription factor n=1 Tax=Inhella gelatinilytica TaxID=2795030 RepID=A0A931IRG0_9BURK|nr:response regulator [Inhella gelatinilytica]MBH9551305.1 response regulator transcription factor [Inhella gelatinilytica]